MKIAKLSLTFVFLFIAACGGGSGGGSDGPAGTATITPTPDPNASPTPTIAIVGSALFVRDSVGNDANDGRSPAQAFSTIQAALAALPGLTGGRNLVVGPGTYNGRLDAIPNGTEQRPVVLLADPTGASTQDSPGPVILTSTGTGSTILVNNQQYVTIDGFQIRGADGGNRAGIEIRTSSQVTVRNCEISGTVNQADGIAVLGSNEVLLINNLIYENSRRGVRIAGGGSGSRGVRLINNTIANNGGQGVVVGTTDAGSEADLLFNIIQDNTGAGIIVTSPSLGLFSGDSNLVFPDRYDPDDLPREFDINEDALFIDPFRGLYLLSDESAGEDATSPAVDAGFEEIFPADLLAELAALKSRTTSTSGQPDEGELDLGYHAPRGDGGPVVIRRTFYVRENGDDSRTTGRSPADAFRSIRRALDLADGGDTIIVGPGGYSSRLPVTVTATAEAPLTIRGDPTGLMTEDGPGPVVVAAARTDFGFRVTGAAHVIIDGFTIIEAIDAAIEIRGGSENITVRNCFIDGFGELLDARGDGIRVDDSANVSLINNLAAFNDSSGILVRRSTNTRIINNTLAENGVRGIRIGSGASAAPNTLLQNNIVYFSGAISVEFNAASAPTAALSHNLVFPATYRPLSTIELPRPTDSDADPEFVAFGNFRLSASSPARDAADPATGAVIVQELATRTTSENDAPDGGALDLGFHFAILPEAPTPTPSPTMRPGR